MSGLLKRRAAGDGSWASVRFQKPVSRIHQTRWRPPSPAAGDEDLAPGLVQLLCDLASCLSAADDQHRAVRQGIHVRVLLCEQLVDARWDKVRAGWPVGALVAA